MKELNSCSLFTALITPMNDDESINFEDLEILLRQQEKAGNGILILGSTGESLNLSLKEKKEIIHFTMNLKLNVPLMAGIGGVNLNKTLEWMSFLEEFSLDSYLLVTPLYAKPGNKGQKIWFEKLLNKSTKPCVLYNVPSRTGIDLSIDALKELNQHPNFWGVKEASGCAERFSEYVAACEGKRIFCGDDALMPEFARRGAEGLISVASNSWPEETALYTRMSLEKKLKAEDEMFWLERANLLFSASNPIPVKRLIHELGLIETSSLRLPLYNGDLKDSSFLLKAHKEVQSWAKDYNL